MNAVSPLSSAIVGANVETGGAVEMHRFTFHDAKSGKRMEAQVLADAGSSPAMIEDMAANALESWIKSLRDSESRKVGKHAPNAAERRGVGKAIREFREYALKRRESSKQRIYYPVG
mgnify:FL=1